MPAPEIDIGRPWIAFLVALGALGIAVWLLAGADEAALDRPTVADRLAELADQHDDPAELVVPAELPPEWREPGIETAVGGDELVRFELRLVRRFENPDRDGAFVAVRVYVCTAEDVRPCLRGRTEITRSTSAGTTTVVAVAGEQFLDEVRADWTGIDLTADWRSADWPSRLR